MYIYEQPDWPQFYWDKSLINQKLTELRHQQGRLLGRMQAIGLHLQDEAVLQTLTQDVLKSSEIEGEVLDTAQVRSSLARRLGLDIGGVVPVDRHVDGVVEMMLDATRHYSQPLTKQRLFAWHGALFPTGYSGLAQITVGAWRDDANGPMQVVSGPIGRERVHYQAPPALKLEQEMDAFLTWFGSDSDMDPVLKAGLAHLWFVSVHPFDDGNGRMARAIADMALARSENSPQRFYSMSTQIRLECDTYYDLLESTQKSGLDITHWLDWFLDCLSRSIAAAQQMLALVLAKARFWEQMAGQSLNARQIKLINRLLDGFEGKLTSSKWAKLAKCSQDTAHRDITDLLQRGIMLKSAEGGRGTNYGLVAMNFLK